ncbi:MAG: hypothetical protein B6241_03260 [Spirochaetaceae bacterium 4572_59]|nr:MAG: hypothetical protein B6241_03260 [Spirochaetaceae bacterium 4572_59]
MPRGSGNGMGQGQGQGGRGQGQGRSGGGYGSGGYCICAKCGAKVAHSRGISCTELKCPECGKTMIREELLNDRKENKG